MRQRQAGFLVLTLTVKADGSITDLKVRRQFDHWPVMPSFERSALAAAKEWRAVPEQVDGQPMTTHVRRNVNFILIGDGAFYTDDQIRWLRQAARKEATVESLPGIPLPSDQFTALDSPLQPTSVAINSAP